MSKLKVDAKELEVFAEQGEAGVKPLNKYLPYKSATPLKPNRYSAARLKKINREPIIMKQKYFVLAAILIVISIAAKAQTSTLTLKDCIDSALKNNISVKQSELLMDNAGLNYRQAKYDRLPLLNSSFNYGINNGRSIDPFTNSYLNQQLQFSNVDAQASVPVFNGFRLKNTITQKELAFAGATMEWQQRKDELTLQIILAYLQVLNDSDAIVLAKQQAAVSRQQVDRLAVLSEEGAIPPGNFSDLKGQYAGDRLAVVNAQNSYASSVLALTQLMNIRYNGRLQFDKSGVQEEVKSFDRLPDDIYSLALQNLATVKASEFRISSSAAAVKTAAAAYYPRVSLFGGASTNYSSAAQLNNLVSSSYLPTDQYVVVNGANVPVISKQDIFSSQPIGYVNQTKNNISTFFGVSMTIPIFSAFKTRTAVQLARNDEKSYRLIAENIRQQLRQGIDQAFVNINAVYRRYQALEEQADAYNESFRIASVRFENGVINAPEYLIAKNNIDLTNANIIIAKYEYLLRKKILDFYMGK